MGIVALPYRILRKSENRVQGSVNMEHIKYIISELIRMFEMHVLCRIDQIRVRDIFDILLLSIIFFFVFKFIINKRAARLALGLVFVLAVMVISILFDMKAMTFIFTNFAQAGIIAMIIMFQPELRSALEKLGNAPLSNIKHMSGDIKNTTYISNSIATITETACALSLEKTGALIVIEQSTKLGEHIMTGTMINAQLSSQLLKNIFYNKAPLHDGAVILRNYRIFSAGCFLPLSLKEDIDESVGTRHRAALGISEVSDAVVVIVSEETGLISIAHDGELKRNYNYNSLQKELTQLLLPNETQKNSNSRKSKKQNKKEAAK